MAAGVDDDTWRQDPDTDVVLSDVHIGAAPSTAQLCTTLFCFTDGWRIGRASCSGNTCNRGSNGSSASRTSSGRAASAQLANHDDGDGRGGPTRAAVAAAPMQTDEDGDVIVKRRRTGADARSSSSSRQPCITGGSNSDDGASDGIVVHHAMATSLRDVGKQVWRGALLLADLLLDAPGLVAGRTVVELGAGCGVVGVAAARAGAEHVLLTDLASITPALKVNVQANAAGFAAGAACVTVHSLDWSSVPPPCCFHSGAAETEAPLHPWLQWAATNGWNAVDLQHLLHAEVLLAADCVYDNELTDAFMAAAAALLQPPAACSTCGAAASPAVNTAGHAAAAAQISAVHPANGSIGCPADAHSRATGSGLGSSCAGCSGNRKRMFVALEKRYNFTLRDADVRASAYEHWLTLFRQQHDADWPQPLDPVAAAAAMGHLLRSSGNRLTMRETGSGSAGRRGDSIGISSVSKGSDVGCRQGVLVGRRLDVAEVAQVLDYERGTDLELWELWAA